MKQGPRDDDRWSRSDWWGVVLDAPDVDVLARFYSGLRGWAIWKQDATGAALDLDFEVTDLDEAVAHALSLGAELPDFQPQDDVRILLDPAGHPFCLYT